MPTREELQSAVSKAEKALASAKAALLAFDTAPPNNNFASLEAAEDELTERLADAAADACDAPGCFGDDKYVAEFTVDGVAYIGTLEVEYNRHDKKYYYVEKTTFSYVVKS